ncbi:MAG: histidine--tRNA ligase [Endomicrobium sp.]|jgi:histidyl-tRNA synthetase|nr:histidine--tRNA ligase [Endomicrobium sp.]
MNNYKAPRGTHDIFGQDAINLWLLEQKVRNIFMKYGFYEMKTPMFEDASLFSRSIGDFTDVVEKEMYIFKDKKNRILALRPEGTASLARAFIEHKFDSSKSSCKFFYIGEMFRYERPQSGRYREFNQIGAEYYGNESPSADVELIMLAKNLMYSVGINDIVIHINSLGCENCRGAFSKVLLKYFNFIMKNKNVSLCENCMSRLGKNPFRLLDCKIDSCKFSNIPIILNSLCNVCNDHFNSVISLLDKIKCNYVIDNKLVRGLDYYTKTIFEIYINSDVSNNYAIAAGGRYDNLIKDIGGRKTPAVGFAFGVERLLLYIENNSFIDFVHPKKIFIAVSDQKLFYEAFKFALKIRNNGFIGNKNISVFGPIENKKLTDQLKFADKIGVLETIIFAVNEFKDKKILVKNMKEKKQKTILIDNV